MEPSRRHNHGALKINIVGVVVDKPTIDDSISKISHQFFKTDNDELYENSLFSIVHAIRQAKYDKNITGIVLDLKDFVGADQPSLRYLGKALSEFRSTGKPILSINDSYTQHQYYLASFANTIYLSPQGKVDLHGFSINNLYYKTLLDKLKITSNVFRVGTYKSAVEPFLRDNMSPESREVDTRWIQSLWKDYIKTIAKNRNIHYKKIFPEVQELISDLTKLEGDHAQYAKEKNLVDHIASHNTVDFYLNKIFGFNEEKKDYNNINLYDYLLLMQNMNNNSKEQVNKIKKDNIGLIMVSGPIIDGEDIQGYTGSNSIVKQIRAARFDNTVKAIILRINSPGGSLSASEQIREELATFRISSGKPVVVSMGGTAASGGYWISTPADYIIASPNTLTGSIGIFGIINTIEKLLNEIGIHSDGVSTSPLLNLIQTKELTPELKKIIQLNVENGYKTFIDLVSKSRKQSLDQIEKIAQGIVWTGNDAKINGLIDQLGDFDDAVNKAAQLAHLKNYQLYVWQQEPSVLENLINRIFLSLNSVMPKFLFSKNTFSPYSRIYDLSNHIKKQSELYNIFTDPQDRYVICLNCFGFKNNL